MPQLPPDKELIMHRFAESVANNKEKYITIDLFDPNAMKKYFDDKEKKLQSKVRLRAKKLKLGNNKTKQELANNLGVDKSTYNKYENGKRKFNNDVLILK